MISLLVCLVSLALVGLLFGLLAENPFAKEIAWGLRLIKMRACVTDDVTGGHSFVYVSVRFLDELKNQDPNELCVYVTHVTDRWCWFWQNPEPVA